MLSVHTSPLEQPGTGDAGGMNVYVTELSKALARGGVQVEIFTRRTSGVQPDVVQVADGVAVRHVTAGPFEGLDKTDLPGQLCAFTAGVLRAEAAREPGWYDVVHAHYWLSAQAGWLAADRWDVPLVVTMHTLAKVKNAALADGDAPEPAGRTIGESQVVEIADALVANTADEARELVGLYGADPDRVHVVEPGVDLEAFRPPAPLGVEEAAGDVEPGTDEDRRARRRALGLPGDRSLVLFAGRVQPHKAPDVLVRALGALHRAGAPVPTLLVLGGASGRRTAVRELLALAHQEGVAEHVVVRDPVPPARLAEFLHAADLVAVPSYSESFGLVAAEAQAAGTPVVAAAVGGLRTVVDDGVTGVLVPDHDPGTWAWTFETLLADPGRRAELRAAALASSTRFGWDRAAKELLGVYEQAARARAAR
ncbi:D-inositol-3-phosphate glycosyltransferase [Luteimicrobium subarcticum]|nr:D-inositol-3-phosphate glycosyltransferase [Luteimicrobium subarcticum]